MWRHFKSKKALVVILWYMIVEVSLASIPYTSIAIAWNAVLITIFFLYPVFGMVADVWCGRLKTLVIGTWITWVGALAVTICTASAKFMHVTSAAAAVVVLQSVQQVGVGVFQANALQFGVDQLRDAPSEQLSSYVYWYIWSQEVSAELYNWWLKDGLTSVIPNHTLLVMLLITVALLSLVLCAIPSLVSRCDFKPPIVVSNPYVLIYRVLSFAWAHKLPLNRSAFTYWEELRPSRVELGETKYGGPFSHEQIEDVKALFRITKLLLLLTGFFACRNGFNIIDVSFNLSQSKRLTIQGIVTATVLISLPLHELLIYPHIKARYPGSLLRTSIGAVLSLLSLIAVLLCDAVGYTASGVTGVPDGLRQHTLTVEPWLNLPTWLCGTLTYLIFTTSVLEFIVAQAPQSMRGMIIGIYYCIGYGLAQALAWLLYLPFNRPDYTDSFSNGTAYLTLITAVGIVSVGTFVRAADKYRYRERDEIVEVHVFAEKYYSAETST